MGTSVIPNKLKEELGDVKKVYDYGKTICTHPNSFDRLQTEIVKVCNVNKELEKENAELKEQVKISYEVYNDNLDYSYHIEGQLTNAKEIISEYVRLANLEKEDTVAVWQLYHKAEQFLEGE